MSIADLVPSLRSGEAVTGARARAYAAVLLLLLGGGSLAWTLLALPDGLDALGRPLGTDFLSFWASSRLVWAGRAAAVYDPAAHLAVQTARFGAGIDYFAFFYPPPYLLACAPLALLPYLASLLAWLAATGCACFLALRRLAGRAAPASVLVAFPAVWINAWHGQNAFLTTALFAAGIMAFRRRPAAAGATWGLLVIKPHLALALPVMLAVRGEIRALLAGAAVALACCGLATLAFGPGIWAAFLGVTDLSRRSLEDGLVGFGKMQSVFAGARLLGVGTPAALGLQGAAGLSAFVLLARVARASRDPDLLGAAAATATLLATPFLLDYDLMLLAIPIAVLARLGRERGFQPWEKSGLALAYFWPLFARPLALGLSLPLTPLVVLALLGLLLRRSCADRRVGGIA